MLFEVQGLTKRFGGLAAIQNVDLGIEKGKITGLIGPNGAGKSTFFNLVTGFIRPTEGTVRFMAKDITRMKPYKIAKLGIGRSFQLVPLFGEFTTLQNIVISCYLQPCKGVLESFFNTAKYRLKEKRCLEYSLEILNLVGLYNVKDELAKNLPHGYQKLLGIARSLAVKPTLIMLDEPLAGMNRSEVSFAMDAIKKIQSKGITILIVEHNMRILDLCAKVVVINFGTKIAEGTPFEIRQNKEVVSAYLGGDHAA